jgi:hypothetical protein
MGRGCGSSLQTSTPIQFLFPPWTLALDVNLRHDVLDNRPIHDIIHLVMELGEKLELPTSVPPLRQEVPGQSRPPIGHSTCGNGL